MLIYQYISGNDLHCYTATLLHCYIVIAFLLVDSSMVFSNFTILREKFEAIHSYLSH
jgi:hypothetical protein